MNHHTPVYAAWGSNPAFTHTRQTLKLYTWPRDLSLQNKAQTAAGQGLAWVECVILTSKNSFSKSSAVSFSGPIFGAWGPEDRGKSGLSVPRDVPDAESGSDSNLVCVRHTLDLFSVAM